MTPSQVADSIARGAGGYNTCDLRLDGIDYPVTAFVGTFMPGSLYGAMIAIGDRHVWIAADGLTIEPTMETLFVDAFGNALHMVSKPAPLSPGGEVLLWECHCRG